MVLGYKPVDKPIIPRRSFFDKDQILGLTGRFNGQRQPTVCRLTSNYDLTIVPLRLTEAIN
ncbi:hypothetical protein D3C86_1829250 [compost metagenome]